MIKHMKKLSAIIALILMFASPVSAWDIRLMWAAPTLNTDGTPLVDLAGYRIYKSTTAGEYSITDMVDVADMVTHTFPIDTAGTYYFVATAYDKSGNESDYSNEVSQIVTQGQLDRPSPPITITTEGVPTKPVIIFQGTVIIGTP